MKTYQEIIEIIESQRDSVISKIKSAHRESLNADADDTRSIVIALDRKSGELVHEIIEGDKQPRHWFVLAVYPFIRPIEAVVLYADEKAAILYNWCKEQDLDPPEQGKEGDVSYLKRMIHWMKENAHAVAGDVLTDLAQAQLLEDFDAESELADALETLNELV